MQIAAELRRMRVKGQVGIKDLFIDFAAAAAKAEFAAAANKAPVTAEEKKAHVKRKKEGFLAYFPNIKVIKRKKSK